jgi:hypothetical protein
MVCMMQGTENHAAACVDFALEMHVDVVLLLNAALFTCDLNVTFLSIKS